MIVIKGIEMPKNCGKCTFREFSGNDNFYHCTRIIGYPIIVDKEKYLDNCPLKEIVTCKECKHRNGLYTCEKLLVVMEDDCFCCFGEMRE